MSRENLNQVIDTELKEIRERVSWIERVENAFVDLGLFSVSDKLHASTVRICRAADRIESAAVEEAREYVENSLKAYDETVKELADQASQPLKQYTVTVSKLVRAGEIRHRALHVLAPDVSTAYELAKNNDKMGFWDVHSIVSGHITPEWPTLAPGVLTANQEG